MWFHQIPLQSQIFFTWAWATVWGYLVENKDKRMLTSMFKNYISPELIDQMVNAKQMPQLGGSEGNLTAYFTDIASFSTFSEQLGSPTKLVELLNEYLTAMTDILVSYTGTLDKYEGDAIIAFFGAPVKLENHALSACKTALAMQGELAKLRVKWHSEGDKWPEIVHNMRMRIGLNSGPIVTGNMGSAMRMNYTMMGDAVNTAARLESGAKQYGVFTMCSEKTLQQAGAHEFVSRLIDKVKVMGKTEPVVTYELLSTDRKGTPELRELVEKFNEARALFVAMKWDEAEAKYKECLALEPNHPDREKGCLPPHLTFSLNDAPCTERTHRWLRVKLGMVYLQPLRNNNVFNTLCCGIKKSSSCSILTALRAGAHANAFRRTRSASGVSDIFSYRWDKR